MSSPTADYAEEVARLRTERNLAAVGRTQAIAERDAAQSQLKAHESEHAAMSAEFGALRESRDAAIGECRRIAAEVYALRAERDLLAASVAELTSRTAELETNAQEAHATLRTMYSSRSWRWTGFLRR